MAIFDIVSKKLEATQMSSSARAVVSGALAGACGAIVTHPLDVVKAQMSLMDGGSASRNGLIGTFRALSLRQAYSGLSLSVLETAPQAALRFSLMLRARDVFVKGDLLGIDVPSSFAIIGSSAVAGVGKCKCLCCVFVFAC